MAEFNFNDFEQVDSDFDDRTAEELYAEFLGGIEKPKDEFIYCYGKYYNIMKKLTGSAKDLLIWLTFHCEVNTGRVLIQSETLKEALREMRITVATYYKSLAILKETGVIKGGRAKFFVNPSFAWKGTADMRNKFMKIYHKL